MLLMVFNLKYNFLVHQFQVTSQFIYLFPFLIFSFLLFVTTENFCFCKWHVPFRPGFLHLYIYMYRWPLYHRDQILVLTWFVTELNGYKGSIEPTSSSLKLTLSCRVFFFFFAFVDHIYYYNWIWWCHYITFSNLQFLFKLWKIQLLPL